MQIDEVARAAAAAAAEAPAGAKPSKGFVTFLLENNFSVTLKRNRKNKTSFVSLTKKKNK